MQNARSISLFIPLVAEKVTRWLSLVDRPSTFIPNAFACIPNCSTRQAADLRDLVGMELLLDISWRYDCVVRRSMLWPRTSCFSSFVFSLPLCHCQVSLRHSRPVENLSREKIPVSGSSWPPPNSTHGSLSSYLNRFRRIENHGTHSINFTETPVSLNFALLEHFSIQGVNVCYYVLDSDAGRKTR